MKLVPCWLLLGSLLVEQIASYLPQTNNHHHPNVDPLRPFSPNKKTTKWHIPHRKLSYPFPNGRCGGTVITIPAKDTYGIDVNLAKVNVGGIVLPPRDIQVWLPPNYQQPNQQGEEGRRRRRHPVLYVHDGENSMEDADSWTGQSWRLTGALMRLADHQLLAPMYQEALPICVLLPSTKSDDLLPGLIRRRHLEYGDLSFLPFAKAHVDFVAQTLKPLIDARFDTNPAADATFTMGASLGGQASLNLLLQYPDLFGGAACLSPAFGPTILADVVKASSQMAVSDNNNNNQQGPKKIYMDIGGDSDDVKVPWLDLLDHVTPDHWWNPGYFWLDTQLQAGVQAMCRVLDQERIPYDFHQIPGGRHNERAWAQRMDKPLLHLYGRHTQTSNNNKINLPPTTKNI
jgi:enterochelin esterase-like enzyme